MDSSNQERPAVTVTYGSSRPGGIDVALVSLCEQSFKDFEVVFVDGRYHERHERVLAAVKESGLKQPFFHVPNHRYRNDPMGSSSAGFNTGFALAAGRIVVMMMDYAYAGSDWLSHHVETVQSHGISIGPIHTLAFPEYMTIDGRAPLDFTNRNHIDGHSFDEAVANILHNRSLFDEISIFRNRFSSTNLPKIDDIDPKSQMDPNTTSYIHFHTKNEAFYHSAIMEVNGMDENCDRACLQGDLDLGLRLTRFMKAGPRISPKAALWSFNIRKFLPKTVQIMTNFDWLPPPLDRFLPINSPESLQNFQRILSNSNYVRTNNPVSLSQLRSDIYHWRELSQEPKAIIPKRVISDADYYPDKL